MTRLTRQPRLAPTQSMMRAGQRSLRDHNLCLAFSHISSADPDSPRSRADLAEITGLTKATVSSLVTDLRAAGLVAELLPATPHRVGRPAIPLVVASGTVAALGLEINVDFLGVRGIDLTGAVLAESFEKVNLRQCDPQYAFSLLLHKAYDVITELLHRNVRLIGAGLALPGIADHPSGPLRLAPNLGWRDVDIPQAMTTSYQALKRELGSTAHKKTLDAIHALLIDTLVVDNEANLAARSEIGKHKDSSFIYVSGEIGVGAAIVVDGHVFSGVHGWAGEIGHVVVDPDGRPCACGSTGCLEMYAGKRALMSDAGLDGDDDISHLRAACLDGQPQAREAVDRAADALGIALADCMNVVDVTRVVLGGSFADLTDLLRDHLSAQLSSRVLASRWVSADLEVRASESGVYAAATGSALSVLDKAVNDPTSRLWRREH
ncbi:MAG: ROK family transcriptional regulator [Propionibacteriaceae bacterium]|nr:ROK family transcriptional regulator [Propionibacteriaceae bacterium]